MKNSLCGWERSAALSLLLLALATLFLLDNGRGYFYWPGHHDWNSAKNLALAENLSPEYNFALFHRLEPDQDGVPTPSSFYHRFPIGGFALIKLAILPFGDNLSAKIVVGRTLMLAFFSAAAVLAYLALSRITGSQWIACAATGLAFSSYYCLLYSNMNCTEVAADLFAVMLVFHALTVFVQEGHFRQLLVKTCIALLLGWHVYALLLPFIVFSLASAMFRAHTQFPNAAPLERMRHLAGLFFLSRPVALGAAALSFGLLVLLFGLLNEWFALGGAPAINELPTFRSMLTRTGLNPDPSFFDNWEHHLAWPIFLENQFSILGGMVLPYAFALLGYAQSTREYLNTELMFGEMFDDMFPIGAAALVACLVGCVFTRKRILLATLSLFGFFWSLPMRNSTAFHDFEGVFYVGVPLTLFSLVLLYIRRLSGERMMAIFAVAALLVFVFSNRDMSRSFHDGTGRIFRAEVMPDFQAIRSVFHAEVMADFQAIRSRTADGAIGVMLIGDPRNAIGAPYALEYYLAQRVYLLVQYPLDSGPSFSKPDLKNLEFLHFIVTNWREPEIDTLTPENQRFFLYSRDAYVGG